MYKMQNCGQKDQVKGNKTVMIAVSPVFGLGPLNPMKLTISVWKKLLDLISIAIYCIIRNTVLDRVKTKRCWVSYIP